MVQRYLTTKDEATARRGVWLNAVLTIPATLLFFAVGTGLYVFFKARPDTLTPALTQQDAVFPWFVVTQMPDGVAGVLIGGLFAAAMSSLDSSMNSIATAVTTDFYRRFRPDAADATCLKLARVITVVVGVAGTVLALYMAEANIQSLWDRFAAVMGLFASGLAGLFLLGMFTERTSAPAALGALLGSTAIQLWLSQFTPVHSWTLPLTGTAACCAIGLLLSAAAPNRKVINGLTVKTLAKTP